MEVSDWQFEKEFDRLYLRAQRYGIDYQGVMNDEHPLIWWKGCTDNLKTLGDSSKEPPLDVKNIRRSKPDEEFICWLMLPKDFSGKNWYFGRVFSKRHSLPDQIRAFQDVAADAGSLLRRDRLFREYLSPCLKHIELVKRFRNFRRNVDASYWCALLFARPELTHPVKFPYKKSKIVGEGIAEASIANPFKMTADVITRWRLNSPKPVSADGRIAKPFEWPDGRSVDAGEKGIPQTVTLDQMASAVSRSKKTLERRKTDGTLPRPDIEGGGGKPDEWHWVKVKPILERHFNRKLPDRFPSLRR